MIEALHTDPALADLRVVEFSAAMAGPWIGRFMAWCGADVIRVESRDHPDVVRLYVPPRAPEQGTQPTQSPWFTDWNAGKRFVALDLTHPDGVEIALRLVAHADVVVENFSTGVMAKLGLGWERLRETKSDLIMISTTGYGDTGPDSQYVSWGPNLEALSGLASLSGPPERECTMTQFAYPDSLSALHGLFAVLCALDHRERTGQGQFIGLSQLETVVAGIGPLMMEQLDNGREPHKPGNGSLHAAPHGCYPCQGEDRWCTIAVTDDEAWRALCAVTGMQDWLEDPELATAPGRVARAAELDARLSAWTGERDAYDVMDELQEAGVPAGVVQHAEDLYRRDPQLRERGFFEELPHLTKGTVEATGVPLGLTGTPGSSGRTGAALGEDNDAVFGELLGMTPDELQRHVESGAIQRSEE